MIAQNWPVPAQSSPVQVVPAAIIDSQAEGEKAVHCHHNRTMSLDENTRLSSMDLGTGPSLEVVCTGGACSARIVVIFWRLGPSTANQLSWHDAEKIYRIFQN